MSHSIVRMDRGDIARVSSPSLALVLLGRKDTVAAWGGSRIRDNFLKGQ